VDVLWLWVLGVLFLGWVVLDGFTIGAGMVLPFLGRAEADRRLLLNTMGRFLLPNEVWLIAAVGVLAGAFARLEGELLSGAQPIVASLVLSWIWRDVAVWFRSRRPGSGWRRGWEVVLATASVSFAASAGLLLAEMVQGLARGGFDPSAVDRFGPLAWLAAATAVVLFATHGSVFLASRATGQGAENARRLATRLVPVALVAVLAVLGAALTHRRAAAVPWSGTQPAVTALSGVALVAAFVLLRRGHLGSAFAATACAVALPVLAVGTALAPAVLDSAAGTATLTWLTMFALPVMPPVLAAQAWLWWMFRDRVGPRTVGFF
jgi:cytochrome bd ubiquinol oxidase subunit II